MRWFLGCDPGLKGGLALANEHGQAEAWEMPPTAYEVQELLGEILGRDGVRGHDGRAYVEDVHAFPGQGVVSAFAFGRQAERIQSALVFLRVSHELVSPTRWLGGLGLRKRKGEAKTAWKRRLCARAQELFPGVRVTLATADALLIAEWARRREAGR